MADVTPIVMIGAGGHARVVAEAMPTGSLAGHVAPHDPAGTSSVLGDHLGDDTAIEELAADGHRFVVGVGFVDREGSARRRDLLARLGDARLAQVRHPSAEISPSCRLGAGVQVLAGAIVGTNVGLGDAVIVNTGAVVDHDCEIGANVHIAPGAVLSGTVRVGDDTLIGVGATVLQGVAIGSDVVVGAGSVVIDDVADGSTVVGVPARSIGQRA